MRPILMVGLLIGLSLATVPVVEGQPGQNTEIVRWLSIQDTPDGLSIQGFTDARPAHGPGGHKVGCGPKLAPIQTTCSQGPMPGVYLIAHGFDYPVCQGGCFDGTLESTVTALDGTTRTVTCDHTRYNFYADHQLNLWGGLIDGEAGQALEDAMAKSCQTSGDPWSDFGPGQTIEQDCGSFTGPGLVEQGGTGTWECYIRDASSESVIPLPAPGAP